MTSNIALMRGINVGGKNKLPMKELKSIFEELGCHDVQTYIQSGNVVFAASATVLERLPKSIPAEIEKRLGLKIPVVLRSAAELGKVVEGNPFLRKGIDTATLHVGFLAAKPTATRVKALDPDRSPPDRFKVQGREIYLCCPNGVARSKLTNSYFDSKLGTTSTMRNWKTVMKLVELSGLSALSSN